MSHMNLVARFSALTSGCEFSFEASCMFESDEQVSTWSDSLRVSSSFTRRFLRAANLQLGYKLHDFPLKFFPRRNYQRRRTVKATFGGSYVADATVIRKLLGETRVVAMRFRERTDDRPYRESFYRRTESASMSGKSNWTRNAASRTRFLNKSHNVSKVDSRDMKERSELIITL